MRRHERWVIQLTVKVRVRRNGYVARNLTTHSTEARVSWPLIVELAIAGLNARSVNSSVRFLLNGQDKELNQLP
jgi:hypothetical protein